MWLEQVIILTCQTNLCKAFIPVQILIKSDLFLKVILSVVLLEMRSMVFLLFLISDVKIILFSENDNMRNGL